MYMNMFAKIAAPYIPNDERAGEETDMMPHAIIMSAKSADGKIRDQERGREFLESMLAMEIGEEMTEGTEGGFWRMTANRLLHYSEDENTVEMTKALAEMLSLLDALLNRDNLQTLEDLLPKAGAEKGTAARLMMD